VLDVLELRRDEVCDDDVGRVSWNNALGCMVFVLYVVNRVVVCCEQIEKG
jgi:hypothetical protein